MDPQLLVDGRRYIEFEDAQEADLVQLQGANTQLLDDTEVEIREGETTTFVADFTPVKRGPNGYVIQPVASGTTVLYGDEEYTDADASASGTPTES